MAAPRYIDSSTIILVCGRVVALEVHLGTGGGEGEENKSGGDDRKLGCILGLSGVHHRYGTP